MAANYSFSFPLSASKFTSRANKLSEKGIKLDYSPFGKDEWRILNSYGISAVYRYDETEKRLWVEIVNKPLLLTNEMISSQIKEWFTNTK